MNNDWREYTGDPSYELYHHGILGQKWGVRRFQNSDGSLTAKGKKRYATVESAISTAHKIKEKADREYESKKGNFKSSQALSAYKKMVNVDKKFADKLIKTYSTKSINEISDKEIRILDRVVKKYNSNTPIGNGYMRERDALKLY